MVLGVLCLGLEITRFPGGLRENLPMALPRGHGVRDYPTPPPFSLCLELLLASTALSPVVENSRNHVPRTAPRPPQPQPQGSVEPTGLNLGLNRPARAPRKILGGRLDARELTDRMALKQSDLDRPLNFPK